MLIKTMHCSNSELPELLGYSSMTVITFVCATHVNPFQPLGRVRSEVPEGKNRVGFDTPWNLAVCVIKQVPRECFLNEKMNISAFFPIAASCV